MFLTSVSSFVVGLKTVFESICGLWGQTTLKEKEGIMGEDAPEGSGALEGSMVAERSGSPSQSLQMKAPELGRLSASLDLLAAQDAGIVFGWSVFGLRLSFALTGEGVPDTPLPPGPLLSVLPAYEGLLKLLKWVLKRAPKRRYWKL
ncbi:hypothetical protein Droror1_Dr00024503 [Drosera rotundifolia]